MNLARDRDTAQKLLERLLVTILSEPEPVTCVTCDGVSEAVLVFIDDGWQCLACEIKRAVRRAA